MSDFSQYHALGEQTDEQSRVPSLQVPQSPPSQTPKTAGFLPNAYPFQQNSPLPVPPRSAGFPANAYNLQHGQVSHTDLGPQGSMQPGVFSPQQGILSPGTPGSVASLTSQMGSMGIGSEAAQQPRKKKDRHAYHNLDQGTGSSQSFNGIPQGQPSPSQFPDQKASPVPYGSQTSTSAPSRLSAPSGAFVPSTPRFAGAAMEVSGTQGRVDPEQIPSIPKSRDLPAQYYTSHTYLTMEQHLPPPAAVPFAAHDQGNSSPKYARLTLNNIPTTADALAATSLPLGIIVQPLAPLAAGEHPIPVLDFGEKGPPRCARCRTYINPFMTFRSGGNKFVCNMCTFPNDVPSEYFAPTDPSGLRVDRDERPELKLGTVEFMVPKEYWAKEPVGLRYLFVIDVSQEAVNRGLLEAFCDGILNALYGDVPEDETKEDSHVSEELRAIPVGSKVGFVTFDKEAHFYNCSVSATRNPPRSHINLHRALLNGHKCSLCLKWRILSYH